MYYSNSSILLFSYKIAIFYKILIGIINMCNAVSICKYFFSNSNPTVVVKSRKRIFHNIGWRINMVEGSNHLFAIRVGLPPTVIVSFVVSNLLSYTPLVPVKPSNIVSIKILWPTACVAVIIGTIPSG